ncbi:unnamed protein product [Phyllotreta striolata]|uniref:Protein odr-4 homolog n=1 Tax=Phyllotreta striolata TaxID=444603 RepID=A0A9N9TXT9_PHYSR|nr:unnamed protein product [Phyllotreta striolata]
MVRTILVDDALLQYLHTVANDNIYAVGLILGQSCLSKDYVVHFAKTPPYQSQDDKKSQKTPNKPNSLEDFNEGWLADHARQATRMLPGGMYVLGIFVVSPEDVFSPFNTKIKSLLHSVYSTLNDNEYLFGSPSTDKLIVHQSSKTQRYSSRSYDVLSRNVQNVELKTSPKKWISIRCDFEINELRFLSKNQSDWPLEKHMKAILNDISNVLDSATFLYDGEYKDKDSTLENVSKKKGKSRSDKNVAESGDASKPWQVSVLQNTSSSAALFSEDSVSDCEGNFRLIGKVVSNLWMQPKMTVSEISTAVKEDILRSLFSRLELHWDSLIEGENSEDISSVHEPPRRVLIPLPDSEIALSDYLFPGEGSQETKVSLEELLDIKIKGRLNINDVEGQADIEDYYKGASVSDNEEISLKITTYSNYSMYVIGLIVSLVVLVTAVLFKFFM